MAELAPISFWTEVMAIRERMAANAPEGKAVEVRIILHNGQSFAPAVVAVDRKAPWLWFEVGESPRQVIAVPDTGIAKLEFEFVPKDKATVGFGVRDSVDLVAGSDATDTT